MSGVFSQWKQVPEFEIGAMNHVDHQNYGDWTHKITQDHLASIGFRVEYFIEKGECFVLRRQKVEYLAPCFLDDRLLLITWISEVGNKTVKRQHRIFKVDEKGERTLAYKAQNLSIFVDADVNPAPIPQEVMKVLNAATEAQVLEYLSAQDVPDSQ